MKVAIIVKGFPPSTVAGTEVATEHIARFLTGLGVEVHIITVHHPGEIRLEKRDGYPIHRLNTGDRWGQRIRYFKDMERELRGIDPDIIHAQGLYSESYYALRIARKLGKKVIVFPRGSDVLEAGSLAKRMLKKVLRDSDLVLTQTHFMRKRVEELAGRPLTVKIVPNGIDHSIFRTLNKGKLRMGSGFGMDAVLLLFVGRLVKKKCPDDVINAFCIMLERISNNSTSPLTHMDVHLVIAGDGELREDIKKLVKGHRAWKSIHFLGAVEHAKVPEIMGYSDILVLPSYAEGFPMTFLEALSAGLPILTSDDGANPEIIINGMNGLISPLHDIERLAANMEALVKDPATRLEMSKANRRMSEDYSWENIASRLLAIYSDVVNG